MSDTVLARASGHNGQLELTDSVLRIRRQGVLGFLTQGLKGDKEILISQISSIQYKPAGFMFNGYLQVAFVGGQEAKGGALQAASDENTVMFTQKQQADFDRFRKVLSEKVERARGGASNASGSIDDLERLAALRDRGVITQQDFELKKRQILGI